MFWLVWLLGSLANAAENLSWNWVQPVPVTYDFDVAVRTPFAVLWMDARAGEASAFQHKLGMRTSCKGQAIKKGWRVTCSVDSFSITAQAVLGKTEMLPGILSQQSSFLVGKSIELLVSADGRIKQLDFVGIDTKDGRQGAIMETLRQFLRRAFVPFDVQLPKDGTDKGKVWRQKGSPMALSLFGAQGTSGGVEMKHRVVDIEGPLVTMGMEARGSMAFGDTMGSGLTPMMRMSSQGRSQFNTQNGLLEWADVTTKTVLSTSSVGAVSQAQPGVLRVRVSRAGVKSRSGMDGFQ